MAMANVRQIFLSGFLITLSFAFPAHSASMDDVPAPLKKMAECMYDVLKNTPGVDHAKLGVNDYKGWTHPFLSYHASEKTQWVQPTRYDVESPREGPYFFMTDLPGIGPLDLHVTNLVIEKWKTQCGAKAGVMTD